MDRYKALNGTTFLCFLDASKAFDRVNHNKLFDKLLNRGVPVFIVRILSFWYSHQSMSVRWGSSISLVFCVSNGVRQGGILSPYLFNVYIDDLSEQLNSSPAGCYIGNTIINHLMYADDLVLICPSPQALRLLLRVCDSYGITHDIKFNSDKSKVMISRSSDHAETRFGNFFINNEVIPSAKEFRYLGHFLCENCKKVV